MFMQPQIMPIMPSLFIGVIAFIVGAIPVIDFLNIFKIPFDIPPIVFAGVLVLTGFLMILDSLLGFSLA